MHIFIDETGSFTGFGEVSAPSLVGALTIPDQRMPVLFKEYAKIREKLPKENGEVKGRLLDEASVKGIVEILRRNEAIFEVTSVDLAHHTRDDIVTHKRIQCDLMTKNLLPTHHENIHKGMWNLRRQLELMPDQLYIQSQLTFVLVEEILFHSPLYFSQRIPSELGSFAWVVDAKDKLHSPNNWERWWSYCVMPMMQSKSIQRPIPQFTGGDYTYFERFEFKEPIEPSLEISSLIPAGARPNPIDLRKLLTENFRFSSLPEPGLELVDIVTNATRRAMRGNLSRSGWGDIPRLMIDTRHQYINISKFHQRLYPIDKLLYLDVLSAFTENGRRMLTARSLAMQEHL